MKKIFNLSLMILFLGASVCFSMPDRLINGRADSVTLVPISVDDTGNVNVNIKGELSSTITNIVDISVSDSTSNSSDSIVTLSASIYTFDFGNFIKRNVLITSDTNVLYSTNASGSNMQALWEKTFIEVHDCRYIYFKNLGGASSGTMYIREEY